MDSKSPINVSISQTTIDRVQTSIYRTTIIEQQNLENFQIFWLNDNINKTDDNLQTIALLRATINYLNIFDDVCDCYDYIANVQNEKVFLIVSGSISKDIIPHAHRMPQIQFIYVYCFDIEKHKQWAMSYEIVRGTYTNMNDICEQLSKDIVTSSHQLLSMDIISTNIKEKEINKQEASFMYFQLLTEILTEMGHTDDAKTDMLKQCRLQYIGNDIALNHTDEFDKTYSPNKAIWWYTQHCFLYEILNKALRLDDIDILFKYRFFLSDLHNQIKQLHSEFVQSLPTKNNYSKQKKLTVFRGQGIHIHELGKKIQNNLGGLLSFNSFLSTSINPKVALMFVTNRSDIQSVLFEINADYSSDTKPFRNIKKLSMYNEEDEVLFSIATIFRIESITKLRNPDWKVTLTLTTAEDEQLTHLKDHFRLELGEMLNLHALGALTRLMGKYQHAQQYFTSLIQHNQPTHPDLPRNYHNIGLVFQAKDEYDKALAYHEKALQIESNSLPSNHSSLATTYINIRLVCDQKGEYDKALHYHEKALEIQSNSLPSNHPSLAITYNNVGLVCDGKGEYGKALEYYEKALQIQSNSLPSNHSSVANTYNNVGLVYYGKSGYDKALDYYEKALQIQSNSLPSNHSPLAITYNNVGLVCDEKGEYGKALEYYEKALEIQSNSLPLNHPSLAATYNNIGLV
ncbi:unnamed protein product [Didymodactylos carnosus]|uniref:NAD(P)(+)--arginine ADP-ribosyltransferase n=1 Tax=Didymodactylos carnosus TaxID=1234261 RepID=A0A815QJC0_9BILA|nr:unnamed protein product [Didymodactylos carnosus]CAF4333629.1 unnamed protein product [Didymodactylos carnosus]